MSFEEHKVIARQSRHSHFFRVVVIGLAFLVPNHLHADVKNEYDQEKLSEIKVLLDGLYDKGQIPNYVVEIAKGGESIYSIARGSTELNGDVPASGATIYAVASMAKPIVSTAVLKLIEEGRIGLDDSLSKYFPEFENMLVAPNGDLDVPFEEAKSPITIRHLLTHTSGFTYPPAVLGLGDVAKQYAELGLLSGRENSEEWIEILAQLPLVAHPGETFNYSVSVDVLGSIIELITGERLAKYLERVIFRPLSMKDTSFFVSDEKRSRFARIYAPATMQNPAPVIAGSEITWQISETLYFGMTHDQVGHRGARDSGGGGIYSTADDYLLYAQAIANGGSLNGVTILNPETVALHFQNLMPSLGMGAFAAGFGDAARYMQFGGGFGIKMEEDGSGKPDYYFWGGAANTFFWIDGEDKSVGAFFTHIAPPRYNMSNQIEQLVDEARLK
jgi:CubicO group peptidase (beta-lactamase class C family)